MRERTDAGCVISIEGCTLSLRAIGAVVAGMVVWVCMAAGARGQSGEITVVERPPAGPGNEHYVRNRAPLRAEALIKLPVGSVRPAGWLRRQLELQAEGFVGRLGEISQWLRKEGNAWLSPEGEGHSNWEELPYWLKGFGDMAYLLGDEKLIAEAKVWLEGAIASQREDGYFGPRANLTVIKTEAGGKPDLWPNMVMLCALQSYYEWTQTGGAGGDERVIELMRRYFRWQLEYPEEDFLLPFWQQQRAADNLASVLWLYNRTGESWLLELADKIHRRTANWTEGVANWHGVNIAQSFRGPAVYWPRSGEQRLLRAVYRNYDEVMERYGQVPGGMFGADENARRGFDDPRQAAETCTMVEYMYSFEQLVALTGDPVWADRCEDVAFNSLPASMTEDLRGLRYLTSVNMISSDARSKAPGYQNGGPMQLFDPRDHRCCQHNVAHGWPYFTEHLWMATQDGGLAAVMYAPCEVRARVGDGTAVTIRSGTKYPFEETIEYAVSPERAARFPLYFRVPGWVERPLTVAVNDQETVRSDVGRGYVRVEREWRAGDRVRLTFPMQVRVTRWEKNHDSRSVSFGPLTFSLRIEHEKRNVRPEDAWPAWELWPKGAWNYGLVLKAGDETAGIELTRRGWPADDQPFALEAAPIELTVTARRIPQWQEDHLGLAGLLQDSPARTSEPVERVRLVPMGAARLRIAQFPLAGEAADAHLWKPPQKPKDATPAVASHCWTEDTLTALSDGLEPESSDDYHVPRFTWWPRKGSQEWVQYEFERPRRVSRVAVYWFDDTGRGGCRAPASWRLLYRPVGAEGGEQWRAVKPRGAYGVGLDRYNEVEFEAVETTALRMEVSLRPEYSAGILEWVVE